MLLLPPLAAPSITEETKKLRLLGVDMAAEPSSESVSANTTFPLQWWISRRFVSLISFAVYFLKNPISMHLCSFLTCPWKTTKLFPSAVFSFLRDAGKGSPREVPLPASRPPLPWTTRLFVSLVALLTDVVRRPDGTVRRSLSRLDVMVGPDANSTRGVRTADIAVDPSRNLWFRLFLPDLLGGSGKKLPVIVFFHGGGFAFLSPATMAYDAVCRRICREIGALVVSVNYRLSPEHRCPAPYDDGVDVLRFFDSRNLPASTGDVDSGGNLFDLFLENADLSNCFVAGDSAGANIAHHVTRLWTAEDQKLLPLHGRVRLAGVIVIQPFFGGNGRVESEVRLAGAPLVNTERTDWLWRAFLPDGASRDHEAASPVASVVGLGKGFPPAMVVVGGFDPLQDWQRRYAESLKQRGKDARLVEYPTAIHGFYMLPGLAASATPLMEEIRSFVLKHSDSAAVKEDVGAEKRLHCKDQR